MRLDEMLTLTHEACEHLAELDAPGACLRRLALRCCRGLAALAANSSELQPPGVRVPRHRPRALDPHPARWRQDRVVQARLLQRRGHGPAGAS